MRRELTRADNLNSLTAARARGVYIADKPSLAAAPTKTPPSDPSAPRLRPKVVGAIDRTDARLGVERSDVSPSAPLGGASGKGEDDAEEAEARGSSERASFGSEEASLLPPPPPTCEAPPRVHRSSKEGEGALVAPLRLTRAQEADALEWEQWRAATRNRLTYHSGAECHPRDACEVFRSAKLARPTWEREPERLRQMLDLDEHIIVSCWDGPLLVGLAVALCDGCWVCFLRDLAVRKEYSGMGVGKRLVSMMRQEAGRDCSVILLSSPGAVGFYESVGFTPKTNAFLVSREPPTRAERRRGGRIGTRLRSLGTALPSVG